jgi:hypothetical protein
VQAVRFTPALGIGSWRRFLLAQQGIYLAVVKLALRDRVRSPMASLGRDRPAVSIRK